MNFKLLKVLRIISKVILILVGICIIGYVGLVIYKSVVYKPTKVRVSNVTDSSFTVSWVTDEPMRGIVYYKESSSPLTGPIGWLGSKVSYDDRDYSNAQSKCVEDFNSSVQPDENFTVDGSSFDCENVKVSSIGKYYTHHVTVMNLDSEKEYTFVVGNGIWSWKGDVVKQKTFSILEDIQEPQPVFGKVVTENSNTSLDSIVYIQFKDGSEDTTSEYYSSTTNNLGGWYIDSGNVRDIDGNIINLELSQDTFNVVAQYENGTISDTYSWVYGYFDEAYPDIVVKDIEREENWFNKYILRNVYAACSSCSCGCYSYCDNTGLQEIQEECGYGNVANYVASQNGGSLTVQNLVDLGLCNNAVSCAGNIGAITSVSTSANDVVVNGVLTDLNLDYTVTKNENGVWTEKSIEIEEPKDQNRILLQEYLDLQDVILCGVQGDQEACKRLQEIKINSDLLAYIYDIENGISYEDFIKEYWDLANTDSTGKIVVKEGDCEYYINKDTWELTINNGKNCDIHGSVCDSKSGLEKTNCILIEGNLEDDFLWTAYGITSPIYDVNNRVLQKIEKGDNGKISATCGENCSVPSPLGITAGKFCTYEYGCYCTYGSEGQVDEQIEIVRGGKCPTKTKENKTQEKIITGELCNNTGGCYCLVGDNKEKMTLTFGQTCWVISSPSSEKFITKQTEASVLHCATKEGCKCSYESECSSETISVAWGYYCLSIEQLCPDFTSNTIDSSEDIDVNSTPIVGATIGTVADTDVEINLTVENVDNIDKKGIKYSIDSQRDLNISPFITFCNHLKYGSESTYECEFEGSLYPGRTYYVLPFVETTNGGYFEGEVVQFTTASTKGINNSKVLGTTDTSTNSYFFLPEYGFYTLSINGIELGEKVEKDDNTIYIFYQEGNGTDGLQVPKDPENPQIGEDRIIKSNAFEIEYTKVAEQKSFKLSKGINMISFNYVLKINDNTSTTAMDYILFLRGKGYDVKGITYFGNGRWSGGVYCTGTSKSSCSGNDFPLIPGKGYVVISNEKIDASLPAYTLKDQVPIPLSSGWNLVGINGYSKAYTAKSLIDSINSVEGLTADNVSWWPTAKGRYEGIQVTDDQTYGLDFSISPLNGYFVRIKGFNPSDKDCKSIIWHESGQLNGVCGNSK